MQITLQALARIAGVGGGVITKAFDPLFYLLSWMSKKAVNNRGAAELWQRPRCLHLSTAADPDPALCTVAAGFRKRLEVTNVLI